jgi:hypothetical protein
MRHMESGRILREICGNWWRYRVALKAFRNASLFNKKPPVVDSTIAATFNSSNTFPGL